MGNNNSVVRRCLKVWNGAMGLGGIATLICGILVFRAASQSHHRITIPWFYHGILFVGIVLCALTLLGHLAATTANTCCLATYIVVILLLLIFQTLIIAHAFFHPMDSPASGSDGFDEFTDSLFKYLASMMFLIQAICVLLAALSIYASEGEGVDDGSETEYEDDPRLPLLDSALSVSPWQRDERRIAIGS